MAAASDDAGPLFAEAHPLTSNVAWACTVYSMVPYLGILFVPFAIGFAGVALVKGGRERRETVIPLLLNGVLLVAQVVLWWLLYLIPEIGI